MSLTLGIDTSSIELGLGLAANATPMAALSRYSKNSHAEQIAQSIQFFLTSHACLPSDISSVAIACGPGSFTGLRIGISFVKGFCLNREVKIFRISSLESLALAAAPFFSANTSIMVAFDGRNNQVFWARFTTLPNGALIRNTPDIREESSVWHAQLHPKDTIFLDTLGVKKSTLLDTVPTEIARYYAHVLPLNRGLGIAIAASCASMDNQSWCTTSDLVAQYLSEPYAKPLQALNPQLLNL